MTELLDCALDLMRRMRPSSIERDLQGLVELCPELTEELLSSVDQPLKVQQCQKTGNEFLLCDYNRDGDSYRSPWSNEYFPPLNDGAQPSAKLRKMEVAANDAFNTYRDMYFEGGVSSVYMWDLDEGFAAVVLIKKVGEQARHQKVVGAWDSIHVVEVQEKSAKSAVYKLTSTIMLHMNTAKGEKPGNITLAGSMTRQVSQELPLENTDIAHVQNMGRVIEDMELKMRNGLQDVYFGKTRDIVNELRSETALSEVRRQDEVRKELINKLQERKN